MIGLIGLLGCLSAVPRAEESWEIAAINQDLNLLDLRMSRGDTELLRGQGRARLDLASRQDIPLSFARDGLPAEVQAPPEGGLVVGPDSLLRGEDGWTLRLQEEGLLARLRLLTDGAAADPVVQSSNRGSWSVEAPVLRGELQGMLQAGTRGEMYAARAVLIHRKGEDPPGLRGTAQHAVYVMDKDLSVGIDQTGSLALSWILVGDAMWLHEPGMLRPHKGGGWEMDFRPSADLYVRVIPRKRPSLRTPMLDRLSTPERWLVRALVGEPTRRIQGCRAELTIAGVRHTAPAMLVAVEYR